MILEGWLSWLTDRGRPRLWWTAPSLRQGVLRQTPRQCYPTCIWLADLTGEIFMSQTVSVSFLTESLPGCGVGTVLPSEQAGKNQVSPVWGTIPWQLLPHFRCWEEYASEPWRNFLCVHVHVCAGQWIPEGLTTSLETGLSLACNWPSTLGWLASVSQGPPISTSLVLRLQTHAIPPDFLQIYLGLYFYFLFSVTNVILVFWFFFFYIYNC